MRNAKLIAILVVWMTVWSSTAIADQSSEGERSDLARLGREIALLERLITAAQEQANGDARFAFAYGGLRSTLDKAKLQITVYLEIERRQPRSLIEKSDG